MLIGDLSGRGIPFTDLLGCVGDLDPHSAVNDYAPRMPLTAAMNLLGIIVLCCLVKQWYLTWIRCWRCH